MMHLVFVNELAGLTAGAPRAQHGARGGAKPWVSPVRRLQAIQGRGDAYLEKRFAVLRGLC